ncbi:MAG TPA: hypothetical protein VKU19_02925, partial [Bryobacteraceae bacterium]|nr:hypothetical protein [Bryobacteraceae bacterium]
AFLVPGNYTITGTGGADVGSFHGTITIPSTATLTSPASGGTATRADGLTVNWTGGSGTVLIQVNSCADSPCINVAATCFASGSAGTFTIPPYVLQALPAGSSAGLVLSSQGEGSFIATGLSAGTIKTHADMSGFGYGWGSGSFILK